MKRKAGILVAVYAAVFAINLDTTIVNVALPSIARELDAGTRDLQWVVDGYNLAFAALVLAAAASDRFGRRPALLVGLGGFAVASVAGGAGRPAPPALIAARVVMGVFAALIFPTTLSIISNAFPDRRRARRRARRLGRRRRRRVATGPVIGGLLLEHFYLGQRLPRARTARRGGRGPRRVPRARVARPAAPTLDRRGLVLSVAMLGLLV